MHTIFFNTKPYDQQFFLEANKNFKFELEFLQVPLNDNTAILATGAQAICVFVNDVVNDKVLQQFAASGIKLIALRCAGFNNVDLKTSRELGIKVVRVPAYSPYAVAEHTLALILALNRKIYRAYNRVKEGNFSLHGLMGFDLHGKTIGIIGLGKIGFIVAQILLGFGCTILGHDISQNKEAEKIGVTFTDLTTLYSKSDVISLHCPLTPQTFHLINGEAISRMKEGVMLINTSRGAIINTQAVIDGLKSGKIRYLGLDVYEEEGDLFFEDLSDKIIRDDVFMRLLSFNNVLVTGHQAFFTVEAMQNIAQVTLQNIAEYKRGQKLSNEVLP